MEQMGHQFTDYEVSLAKGMTDPKQIAEYQERIKSTEALVKTALDNHRESKAAAADAVTDGAIGVVGVGSVVVSGGTSIPLIAGLGLSMGFVKMGTKAAMMGNDYESSQALQRLYLWCYWRCHIRFGTWRISRDLQGWFRSG